jgi:hypothetical protein
MRKALLTVLAVGLTGLGVSVTACTESPLEPRTSQGLGAAGLASLESECAAIQSVTGNAHLIDGGVERTVMFNAFKCADGTVYGWYHALARGPGGADLRVRVECLHVVGNQAWATGTVVAAVDPANVGRPYSFRVIDHGEGASAAPDEFGAARFELYDCATEPEITTRPLKIGNLQVQG